MTTKEVIQQAERITVAHIYSDGTRLYDILVGDAAYSVRIDPNTLYELAPKDKEQL